METKDKLNIVLYIIVGAVLIIGINKIVKSVSVGLGFERDPEKVKMSNDELNSINKQILNSKEKLSFTSDSYVNMANNLYKAMDGVGTNDKLVREVFNFPKNKTDILKIISVFGIKNGKNLKEWVKDDYSDTNIPFFTDLTTLNNIFKRKNINFKF